MEVSEGTFNGFEGTELYYQIFTPGTPPKGVAIVVHGHGDHSGGIEMICVRLTNHGYSTYVFDLRGHGKSSGTRGAIKDWQQYREDLHAMRKLVISEYPQLPLYMIGHSLGGVISLDYILGNGEGIAGLVAIAPAISYQVTFIERLFIFLMGRFKYDHTIENPNNLDLLTQDPEMIARFKSDDLRHNIVTPGLGRGLMKVVTRLNKQAPSITMPVLFQFGLDDEITPPDQLRSFFHSMGSQDKQKVEYTGVRHRPFDDLGRERFFADLLDWLDQHTVAYRDREVSGNE